MSELLLLRLPCIAGACGRLVVAARCSTALWAASQHASLRAPALQALDEGVTQVVCIAAGYDTRAYRFARQGVKAC